MERRRVVVAVVVALAAAPLVVQCVPYGRAHTNPVAIAEPPWDSPRTRELAERACFDCHSNETTWPWYSHVAPVSWAVQHHVDEGRAVLNFSEWTGPSEASGEAAEALDEGEMPLAGYVLLHPEAVLTTAERRDLSWGLGATFGAGESGEDDDD